MIDTSYPWLRMVHAVDADDRLQLFKLLAELFSVHWIFHLFRSLPLLLLLASLTVSFCVLSLSPSSLTLSAFSLSLSHFPSF